MKTGKGNIEANLSRRDFIRKSSMGILGVSLAMKPFPVFLNLTNKVVIVRHRDVFDSEGHVREKPVLDMVNKVCTHKYKPPNWLRYFKYLTLIGVVVFAILLGFIVWCRYFCFGALLGVIPYWLTWQTVSAFWFIYHLGLFAFYLTFSYFTSGRAWCRYFCPLGAIFSLVKAASL